MEVAVSRRDVCFTLDERTLQVILGLSEKCHNQTHALQQSYSITSSARASNPGETSRLRALAVFRLIISSYRRGA